jgi:putative ABC transport system permease protein
MKFKSILKLSFLNLKRRKLRTFLTTLGVSVAIGMLFFLLNTAESIKGQITGLTLKFSDATRIQVFEKIDFSLTSPTERVASPSASKSKKINDKAIAELRKLPNVRVAYPLIEPAYNAEYTLFNSKEATSSATKLRLALKEDEEQLKLVFGNEGYIKEGTFFLNNESDSIILPESVAKVLKAKVGGSVK